MNNSKIPSVISRRMYPEVSPKIFLWISRENLSGVASTIPTGIYIEILSWLSPRVHPKNPQPFFFFKGPPRKYTKMSTGILLKIPQKFIQGDFKKFFPNISLVIASESFLRFTK